MPKELHLAKYFLGMCKKDLWLKKEPPMHKTNVYLRVFSKPTPNFVALTLLLFQVPTAQKSQKSKQKK